MSLLRTVDSWTERTLAEIDGWKDLSPDGKNDRGLEIFAQFPYRLHVSTLMGRPYHRVHRDDGGPSKHGADRDGLRRPDLCVAGRLRVTLLIASVRGIHVE